MGIYQDWVGRLRIRSLRGPIMRAFAAALGDNTHAWARRALLEQLPYSASRQANELRAPDRGVEPGLNESDASLAERLARAPLAAQLYGSPLGMLIALHAAGYTGATVVTQLGRYYRIDGVPSYRDLEDLTIQPSWFITDDQPNSNPLIPASTDGKLAIAAQTMPWWRFGEPMDSEGNQHNGRFGVIWYSDRLPSGWGSAVSPPTSMSTPTKSEVNQIIRIVNQWRGEKAKPMWLRVVTEGHVYGEPGLTYGMSGLVYGSSTVVEWSATTEYA